jgi:succinoglycan biosynthesis protein ExoM
MGGGRVEVTVCICTFQRASILPAIESVAKQELPSELSVEILVINDDEPMAREMIADFCVKAGIGYRHAPSRNISIARNTALDAVTTPWARIHR